MRLPRKNPTIPRTWGQNLNEYSLVIGLVLLATLGGVSLFGNQLSDVFDTLLAQWPGTGSTASQPTTALVSPPGGSGSDTPGSGWLVTANPTNLSGTRMEIALPSGRKMTLNMPDVQTTMETMGPNGVTERYLSQLDSVIAQLRQEVGSDPNVISQLEALSQKGHAMSNVQRAYENQSQAILQQITTQPGEFSLASAQSSFLALQTAKGNLICLDADASCQKASLTNVAFSSSTGPRYDFKQQAGLAVDGLKQQHLDTLVPVIQYFADQIEQSIYTTEKDMYQTTGYLAQTQTLMKDSPGKSLSGNQNGGSLLNQANTLIALPRSPITESNANGICATSGAVTCYRRNGQASSQGQADIATAP